MRFAAALVHHPCLDKAGNIYTTSITNLDVHDIARSSRTYGIDAFYIVSPIEAQKALGHAIVDHWKTGKGATKNRDRHEAMARVEIVHSLEDAIAMETAALGEAPMVLATSAKMSEGVLTNAEARERIAQAAGTLVMFGTGHGLADPALAMADATVEPIAGRADDYNHLSVRSAAAITFDRLLG